ncbi:MAG: hypothetical protein SFW07_07310 [Gammaproteobacteria bacterium]|nr:hypothetical protein [Gammaproteobacteria bacterium]
MGNDPVNKSNEEEYQFIDSESEHSSNFESMTQKSSPASVNQAPSEGKKKIFLAIGAVVAIFCLYKLVDVFSASPAKPKTVMPVVAEKPAQAQAAVAEPKSVATTEPVASSEPAVASASANSLQDKVGTLERVVSKVSESNANLQYQMAGVAMSIADIQNNLSNLSQQISDLSKAKEKPAEPVKIEKKKTAPAAKKSKTKTKSTTIGAVSKKVKVVESNKASYYVKAMIQGRAWLMTSDGASKTVAVGDNLPGYGVVSSIDVNNSEVFTSSGTVIKHNSDDR